jgi:hypothetical protein
MRPVSERTPHGPTLTIVVGGCVAFTYLNVARFTVEEHVGGCVTASMRIPQIVTDSEWPK